MTALVFVDVETTGLDPRTHQPYEIALISDEGEEMVLHPPHTLDHADPSALDLGKYHERGFAPYTAVDTDPQNWANRIIEFTQGRILVGANPRFDAEMIRNWVTGYEPWHYRLIDVETVAMDRFGWASPRGLERTTAAVEEKYEVEIPRGDHTALSDARATKAVWDTLHWARRGESPSRRWAQALGRVRTW